MGDYSKELKQLLREAACTFVPQGKGDDEIWYNSPISDTKFPVDQSIKSGHTANKTVKDAGLRKQF